MDFLLFSLKVWLALTLAIPCVVLALSLLYRNANIFPGFRNPSRVNKKPRWGHTSFYVLGTLLNQGSYLNYTGKVVEQLPLILPSKFIHVFFLQVVTCTQSSRRFTGLAEHGVS